MPIDTQPVTYESVEQKRRAFSRALASFRKAGGKYHNPAPELPASKLDGCELLPNRYALIDKLPKGGVVAEVGVDRGDFSMELLTRIQPTKLYLLDIDISRLTNAAILEELMSGAGRVETRVGDSSDSLSAMADGTFDMIYIDGDHAYDGVSRDIAAAVPKLKPNGYLVFNDYTVWSATSMFHCGVARAVHEFCLKNPWKFRYLALQSMMYNDVVLVREDAPSASGGHRA